MPKQAISRRHFGPRARPQPGALLRKRAARLPPFLCGPMRRGADASSRKLRRLPPGVGWHAGCRSRPARHRRRCDAEMPSVAAVAGEFTGALRHPRKARRDRAQIARAPVFPQDVADVAANCVNRNLPLVDSRATAVMRRLSGKLDLFPKTLRELAEPVERALAQGHAVVEHPFHIVKNRFRHRKLRYRGLGRTPRSYILCLRWLIWLSSNRRCLPRQVDNIRNLS